MSIIELPREILNYILSYNMYPYCNRVCKTLGGIEDGLFMYRYRHIDSTTKIDSRGKPRAHDTIISSIKRGDWESFFFLSSYIWNVNYDDVHVVVELLQNKNRNDIVYKMFKNYAMDSILGRIASMASRSVIMVVIDRTIGREMLCTNMITNITLRRCKNIRYYVRNISDEDIIYRVLYRAMSDVMRYSEGGEDHVRHLLTDSERYGSYIPIEEIAEHNRYDYCSYVQPLLRKWMKGRDKDRCTCKYCVWKKSLVHIPISYSYTSGVFDSLSSVEIDEL
jgi:hypothetical protein